MEKLTPQQIEAIKGAIKAQRWDKHSYQYALSGMDHWGMWEYSTLLKKEIIERFYLMIETKFYLIKHYTTFKNIEF